MTEELNREPVIDRDELKELDLDVQKLEGESGNRKSKVHIGGLEERMEEETRAEGKED